MLDPHHPANFVQQARSAPGRLDTGRTLLAGLTAQMIQAEKLILEMTRMGYRVVGAPAPAAPWTSA